MAELILMERDGARMYVPAARLAEFAEQGWREIARSRFDDDPAAQEAPAAHPEPEAAEKPAPKRGRAKT
ncbi:MAG: hypothetical protein LC130_17050 [Bryobacterales bacterium]|nr:hypothetical protein [Bryobacterales bacterium]MCZ2288575.1 hypothetical protein [Anaerolineales bacterium]